jgi:hypothetical protein
MRNNLCREPDDLKTVVVQLASVIVAIDRNSEEARA